MRGSPIFHLRETISFIRHACIRAVLLGLPLSALLFLHSVAHAAGSSCGSCHGAISRDTHVHGPVAAGDCSSCHRQQTGARHPEQQGAIAFTEKATKLCILCHESKATKKHVHTPVAAGECIACHDPHHSPWKYQLKQKIDQLCLQCHDGMKKHAYVHAPVSAGNCTSCHDPHQSDFPYQLKAQGSEICFSCHKKEKFTGKSVHKPVREGKCSLCHDPHGSSARKLLKKAFPAELYLSYDSVSFALCFDCHDKELAFDLKAESATNFRNGFYNLHTVHVNRAVKGRSCKTCHEEHASSQEKLIKEKIHGFGRWMIPISYTKNETGGTCIVGCHKPRTYDRYNEDAYR